jgi:hypothetical protein
MSAFTDQVHNYHDGVIATRLWEFHNEIHAHDLPPFLWDWERLEFTGGSLVLNLGPEAWIASSHIAADVPGHVRPPVVP